MAKRGVSPLRLELFVIILCSLLHLNLQLIVKSGGSEPDRCIWYDTCGSSPVTRKPINCAYNGTAKPLHDETARNILRHFCPDLYAQSSATPLTCCSPRQLTQLSDQMAVANQVLSVCPSCFHNFLNLYCYLTCSPDQIRFLRVNQTTPTPEAKAKNTVAVTAVDYLVSSDFADGMFNSCKNVQMPSTGGHVLDILCGRSSDQCTPRNWLDYLGTISNGQQPFQINFNISDHPWVLPSGETLSPFNATIIPCSSPVQKGGHPCRCRDCPQRACPTTPPPIIPAYPCSTTPDRRRAANSVPRYIPLHLVVQRLGKHPKIQHMMPPPSSETVMFGPVFNKSFMHHVLDLEMSIKTRSFGHDTSSVSLPAICLRNPVSGQCEIPSVMQYYQEQPGNLDKEVKNDFFVYADYLDHLLYCLRVPDAPIDNTKLNMSCVSNYGEPIMPQDVFCGYDGYNYQNSTSFVLTFIIPDPEVDKSAMIWKNGLMTYIDNFMKSHPHMNIIMYEPST